ncbi:MAG: hypothetical protein ABI859_10520 [Pseudomonadota bacterium]
MKRFAILVALVCLTSARAFAACADPQAAPPLPNGATASREDMLSAHKAFKAYDSAVREYATCLEKTGGNPSVQNEAVVRLQTVADKFNAELRAFKKRGGG